jgi:hypothetical protein
MQFFSHTIHITSAQIATQLIASIDSECFWKSLKKIALDSSSPGLVHKYEEGNEGNRLSSLSLLQAHKYMLFSYPLLNTILGSQGYKSFGSYRGVGEDRLLVRGFDPITGNGSYCLPHSEDKLVFGTSF